MKRAPWLEWEQVTETPYPIEKEMILGCKESHYPPMVMAAVIQQVKEE
jgi:hypothetical protein